MKRDNDFVKAKIISIGDELLIGQVVNTNASWLGNMLTVNGIEVVSTLTIGDGESDIVEALDACSDVEIVLMTGGLGPTADDIRSRHCADTSARSLNFVRMRMIT